MKIVFSENYDVKIDDHPWCPSKYRIIIDNLKSHGKLDGVQIIEPPMADDEDILRVHSYDYWLKLNNLDFSEEEVALADIPITSEIIDLFWRMTGGTVLAGEIAIREGLCVHIGGGFHHAHPSHASGFCLLNDIAIGLKVLLDRKEIRNAAVIDCDLHQGDATARIFRNDPRVFTLSIHRQDAFPHYKQCSDLDFGLPVGTKDEEYLGVLDKALKELFSDGRCFDFLHYQAGVDSYDRDPLGQLHLSEEGLRERDRRVITAVTSRNIPLVVTLGGGYTEDIEQTARLHANTFIEASLSFRYPGPI